MGGRGCFGLGSLGNTGVRVREAFWSVLGSGIFGRGGEELEGSDGKLNREAGSVEATALHAGGVRTGLQRREGWSPRQPCRCRSPHGGCDSGLGPSRRVSCSPQAAGGTRVSTGSFPTIGGETEVFLTEGKPGQDLQHPPQRAVREYSVR